MESIFIVLEDGHVFEGKSFGATGTAMGELVFTTGTGGYIETLTDPSYYGQIVMHTFPLIGNCGMMTSGVETKSYLKGYVVREWCKVPSNPKSDCTIDEYLKKEGIIGICGVDTRELTQIIRENGVMNAQIVSDPSEVDFDKLKAYKVTDAIKAVSNNKTEVFEADGEEKYSVALVDYGSKKNIVNELVKRGCKVTSVPYNTSAEDILALDVDGIVLSNGPGDPTENDECVAEIKKLIGKKPIFAINLGHQLLAIANGGKIVKLRHGHRGANQPVKQLANGRTYISSQNHGYAVDFESLEEGVAQLSYVNVNDNSCEGIDYPQFNAYSVQFLPDDCSGPRDTRFIVDRFISLMGGNK